MKIVVYCFNVDDIFHYRLTLEVEKCLPAKQRQDEGQLETFQELVTDLWKNRLTHVQRVPGGSSSSEDYCTPISRAPSSMLDYPDDYLDEDYSDDDDSSYAATSWQPSEEDDLSSEEWGKGGFHDLTRAHVLNNDAHILHDYCLKSNLSVQKKKSNL